MAGHQLEEGLIVRGCRQPAAQVPDLFADILIVPPLMLIDGSIIAQGGKAVDAQVGLNGPKIIVEQSTEDPKIAFGKVVHRPLQLPHPLGDEAEGVLVGHEQKGQVVLPQVFVKAIVGGQVQ